MIHSTVEASRIIIHMHSLQQMLHFDRCDKPSSMCPRSLICQYLEFMTKWETHEEASTLATNMDKRGGNLIVKCIFMEAFLSCLVMQECKILKSAKI